AVDFVAVVALAARVHRIGHPREDHALERKQRDESAPADVDAAIQPIEVFDVDHRCDHAAEAAAGRVETPRQDEAPLVALGSAEVQTAEATLIATSSMASPMSARVSEMRAMAARTAAAGMRLADRRADELGYRPQEVGALDRLGERAVGAGSDRGFRAQTLARVEVPGQCDESDAWMLALELRDRVGAAGTRHEHVAHHERGRFAPQLLDTG